MPLLKYRHIGALAVPIILAIVSITARKVARRSRGWVRNDFYAGIDLTIAALAILIANIYDFLDPDRFTLANRTPLLMNVSGGIIGGILVLFVVSLHQDYESKGKVKIPNEVFWVGFVANVIGFGVLFVAAVFMPIGR